jgi:hypothetical protein
VTHRWLSRRFRCLERLVAPGPSRGTRGRCPGPGADAPAPVAPGPGARRSNLAARAVASCLLLLLTLPVRGQTLLPGEFSDIDLGRRLIEPRRFPTLTELRRAVREPRILSVLTMKLHGDRTNHHHLPIWSHDGQRLTLQRSQLGVNSSQLLMYQLLSQPEPSLLTQDPQAYDYMFRWGLHSESSFVFARIDPTRASTQIYYSADGTQLELRTPEPGQCSYPALYERTDGIRWLAYEREGRLLHQAWSKDQQMEQPIAKGTSPQWSRDGMRVLMARQKEGDQLAAYETVIRHLKQGQDLLLPTPAGVSIRSPVWSPDEEYVAYFAQARGDNAPWRIVVCPVAENGEPRTVAPDVVVNPIFKSEGPSWEPNGQRIWYFSRQHRQEEYFPLVAADRASGRETVVDYPKCCTTPNDLAINPANSIPEVAFVGHDGLHQDLFILFLNHF